MEEAPFVSVEHARKANALARSALNAPANAAPPAAQAARSSTYSWFGSKSAATTASSDKRSFSL